MKKHLVRWASVAALTAFVPMSFLSVDDSASIQVQAAAEINFDQGSMSDEDYVRSILTQFNELDGYRSEMIDEMTGGSTVTIYDKATEATKVTTVIAASDYNEEMTLLNYVYDDGTTVSDEVSYLESSISYMSALNPDFEAQVEEVRSLVGEALVLTPPAEGLEVDATDNMFLAEAIEFTEITKEGDVVKATIDAESYTAENPEMSSLYPEGTQFSMAYTIDPAASSVTSTLTIDVDEEALAAESSEDELGISVAAMLSDTIVNVVMTPTNEKVPSMDELTTITAEEFQQILADIGLEYY